MQSHRHLGVAFVCNKLWAALCYVLCDDFPSAAQQMKVGISFPLRKVKTEDLALLPPKERKTIVGIQPYI
jgi:hypothetical protein